MRTKSSIEDLFARTVEITFKQTLVYPLLFSSLSILVTTSFYLYSFDSALFQNQKASPQFSETAVQGDVEIGNM